MQQSVEKLSTKAEFIAVDGNRFKPFKNIPHKAIIKGDGKYLNIAAASVLAKTYRDAYMLKFTKNSQCTTGSKIKGIQQ